MHTPRLCIDGRTTNQFSASGLLAQEVIDQLVATRGSTEYSNDFVEKQRLVLLTKAKQVFTGADIKRFNTRRGVGSSPFYWAWEKNFVHNSALSIFHRFRPANRMAPVLDCPTITTILPEVPSFHFGQKPKSKDIFVVPSQADKESLHLDYDRELSQIQVIYPSLRRYTHFEKNFQPKTEGIIAFLTDGSETLDLKKLMRVIQNQYPHIRQKLFSLKEVEQFSAANWKHLLEETLIGFYLSTRTFDWPFLYLEALNFGVPFLYLSSHNTLNELLPNSPLEITHYLSALYSKRELLEYSSEALGKIKTLGILEPFYLAQAYGKIYQSFVSTTDVENELAQK